MVKATLALIMALAFVCLTTPQASALEPKSWSFLYAVGNNLKQFGSLRVGYESWEFGKLNGWAYGAAKNFYFAESYYTSFGFALMPSVTGTKFGLVAAAGANWELFWRVTLRLEIAANANSGGSVFQQGILGLGYAF